MPAEIELEKSRVVRYQCPAVRYEFCRLVERTQTLYRIEFQLIELPPRDVQFDSIRVQSTKTPFAFIVSVIFIILSDQTKP